MTQVRKVTSQVNRLNITLPTPSTTQACQSPVISEEDKIAEGILREVRINSLNLVFIKEREQPPAAPIPTEESTLDDAEQHWMKATQEKSELRKAQVVYAAKRNKYDIMVEDIFRHRNTRPAKKVRREDKENITKPKKDKKIFQGNSECILRCPQKEGQTGRCGTGRAASQ